MKYFDRKMWVREDTGITVIYGIGYYVKSHECQYTNIIICRTVVIFQGLQEANNFRQKAAQCSHWPK